MRALSGLAGAHGLVVGVEARATMADEARRRTGDGLLRVTRPGGRLVVIEADWGMHAIHGADPGITARITSSWSGPRRHDRGGGS